MHGITVAEKDHGQRSGHGLALGSGRFGRSITGVLRYPCGEAIYKFLQEFFRILVGYIALAIDKSFSEVQIEFRLSHQSDIEVTKRGFEAALGTGGTGGT